MDADYTLACPVAAPGEHCCFVDGSGIRCSAEAVYRVRGTPPTWDDYTLVCSDHLPVVRRNGDTVSPFPATPQ